MKDHLFVYGTLGPGRPNEHILNDIGGTWQIASVRGSLRQKGWGAAMGYPGIDLDKFGEEIQGYLFTSENISNHWQMLDKFEGESYQRVTTTVSLQDRSRLNAYIYTLA